MDNFNVGVGFDFTSSKSTRTLANGDQTENQSSEFDVGPYVGYYFPVAEKLKLYVLASGGYTFSNAGSKDTDNYAGYYYGVGPGLSYFISKNVAFEFQVSYSESHYSNKVNSDFKWKDRYFAPSLTFSIYL